MERIWCCTGMRITEGWMAIRGVECRCTMWRYRCCRRRIRRECTGCLSCDSSASALRVSKGEDYLLVITGPNRFEEPAHGWVILRFEHGKIDQQRALQVKITAFHFRS